MSESTQQMHERLCGVIAAARFEALSQPYAWQLAGTIAAADQRACCRQRRLGLVRADIRST